MNILDYLFGKKEEDEALLTDSYCTVELNPIAKSKGIIDEHNKIIKIFKNGELKEEIEYTPQMLKAIKEVDELPVYEESFEEDEQFEFYPFENLGVSKI